jgi:hypothetical protein
VVTLADEKGQEWVFVEGDLSEVTLHALSHIGLPKGEIAVWRDHVFNRFLDDPDPEETLRRLRETITGVTLSGQLTDNVSVLKKNDNLLSHALKSHLLVVNLREKLDRKRREDNGEEEEIHEGVLPAS